MSNIVIVDNYDSFTYNLVQLVGELSGRWPIVVSNDIDSGELPWSQASHFILSPGPGHPDRPGDFGICAEVLRRAEVPTLGVCLGHQGLAAHYGGRVVLAPEPVHGYRSKIDHVGEGLFRGIPSPIEVVRYHSWVVDEPLPDDLEVLARADDGLVMAIGHRRLPRWGVQFHPESILSEGGARLLENFLASGKLSAPRIDPPARTRQARSSGRRPRLRVRHIDPDFDPAHVHRELLRPQGASFWLDSAAREAPSAASHRQRFSYLGAATGPAFVYRVGDDRQGLLDRLAAGQGEGVANAADFPFAFCGGYVGYLGYELAADFGLPVAGPAPTPDAILAPCDRYIVIDHQTNQAALVAVDGGDHGSAEHWLDDMERSIAGLGPSPRHPFELLQSTPVPRRPWRQYRDDIAACLAAIAAGESYELCLTNAIEVSGAVDPSAFYDQLREHNPAPFGALLCLPELWIASSSPELYLELLRSGVARSKPMKGTRKRDLGDRGADLQARLELAASAKDRAENLMVTDLVRNDLGRVCDLGSISCAPLMDVETYASLHQMVTTVQGTLRADLSFADLVAASFPGGSMTGAPKHRTMEILGRLEGSPRGIYSGALGYISRSGDAAMSMCIRMAVGERDGVTVGCGGAIVAGSDANREVAEAIAKASSVVGALTRVPLESDL